jgi:flagellar biosynthesis anti-sigma factor FlgM
VIIDKGDGIQHLREAYGLNAERSREASLCRKIGDTISDASSQAIDLKRERVSISPLGQELRKVKSVIEAAPELREEKVAALREAIAGGAYNVSNAQLADKILQHFLNDV